MNAKTNTKPPIGTEPEVKSETKGFSPEQKIEWIRKDNPKRPSSKAFARYEKYMNSKTVKDYLENGGLTADLKYDEKKGFLKVLPQK